MFYKIAKAIVLFIARVLYRIEIKGGENIPKGEGYIVYCNHLSFADPVFLTYLIGKKLRIMAKKELFKTKFLEKVFLSLGAFPVDRGKNDTSAIDRAAESINSGEVMLIFPEGTRSKTGKTGRFKAGVTIVALKTGANLLPVVIQYSKGMKPGSKITMSVQPMVKNEELGVNDLSTKSLRTATQLLQNKIEEGIEKLAEN